MFSSEDPVVLLITVTQIEAKAVLEAFGQEASARKYIGPKIYYDLDTVGGARVMMTQSEMGAEGPGGALLTIHTAIEVLQPEAVILVGIAFGTDPQKEKVGDILVSSQIMAYEPGKIGRKRLSRGGRVPASPRLLDMFHSGELDWEGPEVRFGLVLSGEKLINNLSFRNQLLELEPEAIGGEMEGAGLYAAASEKKVDWIMVKAICDWADGNKNDKDQRQAAYNAAKFTRHVLELGGYRSKGNAKDSKPTKSLPEEPPRPDVAAPEKVKEIKNPNDSERFYERGPDEKSQGNKPIQISFINRWKAIIRIVPAIVIFVVAVCMITKDQPRLTNSVPTQSPIPCLQPVHDTQILLKPMQDLDLVQGSNGNGARGTVRSQWRSIDLSGLSAGQRYMLTINGKAGLPPNDELRKIGTDQTSEGYWDFLPVTADGDGNARGQYLLAALPAGVTLCSEQTYLAKLLVKDASYRTILGADNFPFRVEAADTVPVQMKVHIAFERSRGHPVGYDVLVPNTSTQPTTSPEERSVKGDADVSVSLSFENPTGKEFDPNRFRYHWEFCCSSGTRTPEPGDTKQPVWKFKPGTDQPSVTLNVIVQDESGETVFQNKLLFTVTTH